MAVAGARMTSRMRSATAPNSRPRESTIRPEMKGIQRDLRIFIPIVQFIQFIFQQALHGIAHPRPEAPNHVELLDQATALAMPRATPNGSPTATGPETTMKTSSSRGVFLGCLGKCRRCLVNVFIRLVLLIEHSM